MLQRLVAWSSVAMLAACGPTSTADLTLSDLVRSEVFDVQELAATEDGTLYAAGAVGVAVLGVPGWGVPSVLRSDDGGTSWTGAAVPQDPWRVFERFTGLAAEKGGTTVYLTGARRSQPFGYLEGVIHRSDDGGRRWTRIDGPRGDPYVSSVVVGRGGNVYVYTCDGLYRSDDHGSSWIHTGLYRHRILFFSRRQ